MQRKWLCLLGSIWTFIGHTHERESDCPVCDGTGEIEPERTKKTGKQITDENAVINIGNAYFRARLLVN